MNLFEETEELLSIKSNIQSVPESYTLPPDRIPEMLLLLLCETIPVIDIGENNLDRTIKLEQIMKARQQYEFFRFDIYTSIIFYMLTSTSVN